MSDDTKFDFKETVLLLWKACGDKQSWESGLTDRYAKSLIHVACSQHEPDDWSQSIGKITTKIF